MRISDWSSDWCSSDLAAQIMFEQQVVGARRLAVDPVVGAHDRSGLGLGDRGTESGQIGVDQIVFRDEHVGHMASRFGAAMDVEMLGRGDHLGRSEEHTSELQSLRRISYAVFCLKKK